MRPAAAGPAARDFASGNESRRLRVFTARQRRGSLRPARRRRRRAADRRRPDAGAADGDAARAADPARRHRARAGPRLCARGGRRDRDRRRHDRSAWSSTIPWCAPSPPAIVKVPCPTSVTRSTRARGTIGGSLANADLGGRDRAGRGHARRHAQLSGRRARARRSPLEEFFSGPMMTVMPPTACLSDRGEFPGLARADRRGLRRSSARARATSPLCPRPAQVEARRGRPVPLASRSASAPPPFRRRGSTSVAAALTGERLDARGDPRRGDRGAGRDQHDGRPACIGGVSPAGGDEPGDTGGRMRQPRMRRP